VSKIEGLRIIPTSSPPTEPARLVDDFTPSLIDVGAHHLCPGCGEPIAMRSILEAVEELEAVQQAIAVFGIGCYTAFSNNLDVEVLQALHGRAPSLATGVNRVRPDTLVFTIQGDGDLANEGLQEAIHAAARGETITCFMLNNGVFGETGGHMTTTTVLGQRTKSSVEGRSPEHHGYPLRVAELLATIEGSAYVARGAVNNAGNVARTKKMILRALEAQRKGEGFSFVEILTMCPTGWFIETNEAPDYITERLGSVHAPGVLLDRRAGAEPAA
jgi:2-oxoglutarate ferredoxin oxidoreductase subunit beta